MADEERLSEDEKRLRELYEELPEVDPSGHGRYSSLSRDPDDIRADIRELSRRMGRPFYESPFDL